jgi:hypothetical protein
MFPLFSVLFPICSQFKHGKQRMFPVFYDLRPLQEMKMEKNIQKSLDLSGNLKNSGNEPDYQEVTAFPVKTDYWERGNSGWFAERRRLSCEKTIVRAVLPLRQESAIGARSCGLVWACTLK